MAVRPGSAIIDAERLGAPGCVTTCLTLCTLYRGRDNLLEGRIELVFQRKLEVAAEEANCGVVEEHVTRHRVR